MIQNVLADFFLCFNKELIVMPLIGIGYWAYRRDLFTHVLFLILLSMIVNSFLKCMFQVPLKSHLNQHGWYAFPSGHMQLAMVLYGRLWWEFRKTMWAQLLIILLLGMGWAMIWKNYHDLADVAAGVVAGVGLLLVYAFFIKWSLVQRSPEKIGFFLLPVTALLIFLIPSIPQHLAHVWQAQGGILGFSCGASLLKLWHKNKNLVLSRGMKTLKVVLGLAIFVTISFLNKFLFGNLGYPWFYFLNFLVCGLWLSLGPDSMVFLLERGKTKASK